MSTPLQRAQRNYDAQQPDDAFDVEVTCPDCKGEKTVSDCCQSELQVAGADEGTNHYRCSNCKSACDAENCQLCQGSGEITVDSRRKKGDDE